MSTDEFSYEKPNLPKIMNFADEGYTVVKLWKEKRTFLCTSYLSKDRPKYLIYYKPKIVPNQMHYSDILIDTINDIVRMYAYQCGCHAPEMYGKDVHSFPMEKKINDILRIKSPDEIDVVTYTRDGFNITILHILDFNHSQLDERPRIGHHTHFNSIVTMSQVYMESVWWVFNQLYNKDLIYEDTKVMPYSTGCNMLLSDFEAQQNYKDVIDPSIIVAFPLVDEPGVSLLAWTTSPWTLPCNMALCVNRELEYVEVKNETSGDIYIILETQLRRLKGSYSTIKKRKGVDLIDMEYKPPFSYFRHLKKKGAFKVLNDKNITAKTGTGIVHQAPYFGEDDFQCCLKAGIISKDQVMCPVDSYGRFTKPIRGFLGKYVKDADKDIIEYLRSEKKLIVDSTMKHSYPHCWITDTPLIYKAVRSWFLKVEKIKDKLLAANSETKWIPNSVKGQFDNWLRDNARDWAISRTRTWGNPIPLWISRDKEEIECVGSKEKLSNLTGAKVNGMHRVHIDHLTILSKRSGQRLHRVPEVFDCWFELGCLPYAIDRAHNPFKQDNLDEYSPANFIAEDIDQTHGWFYALLVIATALFNKAPYKNVIVSGLVLGPDGNKISRCKTSCPNPVEVIEKYGMDALRLYLINSPAMKAKNVKFREEGVRDVMKNILSPWYDAFRLLIENIEKYEVHIKIPFIFDEDSCFTNKEFEDTNTNQPCSNKMDKWIVSLTQSLLIDVKREMKEYRLYKVAPYLLKYIDNLTNWYVRMNKHRIQGENGSEDRKNALMALFFAVYTMVQIYAPFTPILTEFMYQRLFNRVPTIKMSRKMLDRFKCYCRCLGIEIKDDYEWQDSVHYKLIPYPRDNLIDKNIEKTVSHMQSVIQLGRKVRDRKGIPTQYLLSEIIVIHENDEVLNNINLLKLYILKELNIKELTCSTDKEKYAVILKAEPNHKRLDIRLKDTFEQISQAIKELSDEQLHEFIAMKEIVVQGYKLEEHDLHLIFSFTGSAAEDLSQQYEAYGDGNILILLNITREIIVQEVNNSARTAKEGSVRALQ